VRCKQIKNAYVRFGSKADIRSGEFYVRFTPESRHRNGFITEDGYGTKLMLSAGGRTQTQKSGTPQSQISGKHDPLSQNIF
jgi:hypothetical protein